MTEPLRFLLINPINTWSEVEISLPNLGLGYLSSSLKKAGLNVECRVVDRYILEELEDWSPDLVGITSVTEHYDLASKYASMAKWAGTPVIVGGIHISALPKNLTMAMDVGVLDEGESTIVDLVRLLLEEGEFSSSGLSRIKGIVYHNGDGLATTERRELVQPLDNIDFPDRSILKVGTFTSMFSSRGCPYKCTFCSSTRFWNKARFFSAEYVVQEIEILYKDYGVRRINFLDDLFIADRPRLIKIQELLAKKNLLGKITFGGNVRSNLVTEELCHILKLMSFTGVGMGLESGCQATLEYLKGKGNITVENHVRAINLLRAHGLNPYCSFIIGSPKEDKESILKTIKFIKDNRIRGFDIFVLTPWPGTPVWDYAKSRGLVSDDMDWPRLRVDFATNPDPIIVSEVLSKSEIENFYKKLMLMRRIGHYILLIGEGLRHPGRILPYLLRRIHV